MFPITLIDGQDLLRDCLDMKGGSESEPFRDMKFFKHSEFHRETHFVAYDGKRLVGNLAVQMSPYAPNTAWVMQVDVLPSYKGKHIASDLIAAFFQHASAEDWKVEVSSFSDEGDIYLRHVFQEAATRHNVPTLYNN